MKKFLFLLLYFLLAGQLVSAKNYSKGDIVTGTFEPVKRLKIELSNTLLYKQGFKNLKVQFYA